MQELRVESGGDGGGPRITGYAAVFGSMSNRLYDWWTGHFREIILPGAFKRALAESDPVALWNHDDNIVLGRKSAGTLDLREDDKGLHVEINPPTWASNYVESIQRGDVSKMSFAFTVREDNWRMQNGEQLRELIEIDTLYDVSPVTNPAYSDTVVGVRSMVLPDSNIDVQKLFQTIHRHKRGVEISEQEMAYVRSALDELNILFKPTEHPQPEQFRNVDVLRKKLDMLSKNL